PSGTGQASVPIRRVVLFAGTCAFTTQSLAPTLCVPFRLTSAPAPHLPGAPLLPKLRGRFVAFLLHGSLEHLRLLTAPTCPASRDGRHVYSRTRLFLAASLEDP